MALKIIAEMSANHNGSLARALAIVDAAAEAGATGVKIQTWSPGTMCLDPAYTLTSGAWAGRSLSDLYREAWLPWDWHKAIFDRCAMRGIECFSAPFDQDSVDFLEELGCPRFKIASFELVDLELIRYVASKGKPMILSTGMASVMEIAAAKEAAKAAPWVTILKCTSAYPADASEANLACVSYGNSISTDCDFGISDHTPGIGVAVAAAALGATMIEKHLTLSRADGGLDAGFSMEPAEFAQMVTECRRAAAAIGTVKYGCGPNESIDLRRSLYYKRDLALGQPIMPGDICTARPALGLACHHRDFVMKCATIGVKAGQPVTPESLGMTSEEFK